MPAFKNFSYFILLWASLFLPLSASAKRSVPTIICEEVSLVDQELSIEIHQLIPGEKVRVEASFIDDRKEKWIASGQFIANLEGKVLLHQTPSISGNYLGIDPMGLFWSMKKENGDSGFASLKKSEILVSLKVFNQERQIGEKTILRQLVAPEVERIEVREEGLVGVLFLPPAENKLPVVITLTGSNGGISEKRAGLLASHGMATFALAYFAEEGLPANLEKIPLEYFLKAFDWVEKQPRLNGKIALYGVSRGAELSLLLGSLFPERISGIVAALPSSVVYGALGSAQENAWLYQGAPILPLAPAPMVKMDEKAGLDPTDPLSSAWFLAGGIERKEEWEAALIPVEKISCPLLLISGGEDQVWPSSLFAQQILSRLTEKGSSIFCEHLDYPNAGHGISVPYLPASTLYFHPVLKRWFTFGGSVQEDDLASRDSWGKIVHFLQSN